MTWTNKMHVAPSAVWKLKLGIFAIKYIMYLGTVIVYVQWVRWSRLVDVAYLTGSDYRHNML